MTTYLVLKFLHVIGAAVLLGTGAGIAFFMLVAHLRGRAETVAEVARTVVIADFVFTRCGASCPMMSLRMAKLEKALPDVGVRFVSFSVDPEYDTPPVLQEYAESFGAPGRWLFLTGDKGAIFRLSKDGFKLAVDDGTPVSEDEPILHSTRFVLVDGEGRIRGYYDAFDEEAVGKLMREVEALAG